MHFGLEPQGFNCDAMFSDPNIIIILNLILTESRKSCMLFVGRFGLTDWYVRLAGGWWLVLICCERKILLAD
jgi:hypothetical protein